jgi:hypothetical protein
LRRLCEPCLRGEEVDDVATGERHLAAEDDAELAAAELAPQGGFGVRGVVAQGVRDFGEVVRVGLSLTHGPPSRLAAERPLQRRMRDAPRATYPRGRRTHDRNCERSGRARRGSFAPASGHEPRRLLVSTSPSHAQPDADCWADNAPAPRYPMRMIRWKSAGSCTSNSGSGESNTSAPIFKYASTVPRLGVAETYKHFAPR